MGGAGVGDSAAFIGVFDIGQGSFNAVFNADGRPFLYYDMGGGIGGLLFTYPDPPPEFCFSSLRMIVQSHFDEDHYKSSTLVAFQNALNGAGPLLVVPRQDMGLFSGATKQNLLAGGLHIHYWAMAGLPSIMLGATGVEIIKCGGNGKNHNGLGLRVEDPGSANDWVLLPADAHYDLNVFPWTMGGQNPDGQMVGIVPTHHGARELPVNIPQCLGGLRATAYSFGAGNLFGHPFHEPGHLRGDGVDSYQVRGFNDGGRMQTAGRPLDDPMAGPRGSNLAMLLNGATPARQGRDPNQAPGHASIAATAIALVAAASAAAHQATAGAAYGSRGPVAAAYQAALEHHRARADRPVAAYLATRGAGGAAAPIVAAAAGGMQAWVAASIQANHTADAAAQARVAEPIARAVAQLVAAAAEAAAQQATQDALNEHANYAGVKRQIQEARRTVLDATANGSQARVDGQNAARAITGPARGLRFERPGGVAYHAGSNRLLVADTGGSAIVRLDYANGSSDLVAGAPRREGATDGNGIAARFRNPEGLALNGDVLHVADTSNHAIRSVDLANNAGTTTFGTGVAGSTDGGAGVAQFRSPRGVAWDGTAAVLYVADSGNHVIRAIDGTPAATTLAGSAGNAGSADGAGDQVRFDTPAGLALDSRGVLYVADEGNHTIRKLFPLGTAGTLSGAHGDAQSLDGVSLEARFHTPSGIAPDGAGGFFIADTGAHCIRQLAADGTVTTVAGNTGMSGQADGVGTNADFDSPVGLAFDGANNVLWVADAGNHVIRRVSTLNFAVTTPYGQAGTNAATDGQGNAARFDGPRGLCLAGTDLWVADTGNHVIRRIDLTTGQVTTPLGAAGQAGNVDAQGANARFDGPSGLAFDHANTLWVADAGNHRVRCVNGVTVTTPGAQPFDNPAGLTRVGNDLAVFDSGRHVVYRWNGVAFAVWGGDAAGDATVDGRTADARFSGPCAGALDPTSGNLAVVDAGAHTVRALVLRDSIVVSVAGSAGQVGHADATGVNARFDKPAALTVLANGHVLVADGGNHTVRRIDAARVVTTEAGTAGTEGDTDGPAAAALFRGPVALVRHNNDVYIADRDNHAIRGLSGGNVTSMPDVVVSEALAANLLAHGALGPPVAVPNGVAIGNAADAICAAAAHAYMMAMAASFGRPATDPAGPHVLVPAQQPPAAAATAHAALAPITGTEPAVLVSIAAAAALGPAVEVQTTGVAVPGAVHDAAELERRLAIAAVAALVGTRQGAGNAADNAKAAVAAARAACAAARGAPLVGCHRHPSSCAGNVCSLMLHEFA